MTRGRGIEVVARVAGLRVLGRVRERLPLLAVGGGFEPIAVGVVLRFPVDVDAGELLLLAEVHLPSLIRAGAVGAPARVGVAVNGVAGGMARLLARRGGLAGDGEIRPAVNRRDDDGLLLRRGRCGRLRKRLGFGRCAGEQLPGGLRGQDFQICLVELVARPEQAVGDELQVARVGNGLVVVAEGGAEDARLAVLINPRDDRLDGLLAAVLLLEQLLAAHQRRGGGEDFDVVVKLLLNGRPLGQAAHDGMVLRQRGELNRLLRAVAGGLETEEVKPQRVGRTGHDGLADVADAVAVHRAVEVHGGDAGAVRGKDVVHVGDILHVGGALVVDDDVVALGPVRLLIRRERRLRAAVEGMHRVHLDVRAGFEALLEDEVLHGVVVAAAAGEEQHAQGLGRGGGSQGGRANAGKQAGGEETGKTVHVS